MNITISILVFLSIVVGIIIVKYLLSAIIDTTNDAFKNKSDQLKSQKPNQNSSIENLQKIKGHGKYHEIDITSKKTKMKVDITVSDINLIQKDPIRYMTGSPGETARTLTYNYYHLFFKGDKNADVALELLDYRLNTIKAITGIELNEGVTTMIAIKYCKKVSTLIFFLCFHENLFNNIDLFNDDFVSEVYNIIVEEHNKVCTSGYEETNEFSLEMFSDIKYIYTLLNTNENSLNDLEKNDVSDNWNEDDFDFYFDDEDNIDDFKNIENYDDIDKESDTILFCIDKVENGLVKAIEKKMPENPMLNTPLEGMEIMTIMNVYLKEIDNQLKLDKTELGLSDREINYIISKSYGNVYQIYFES